MEACTNCGVGLAGKYCSGCGQKKFALQDLSVATFFKGAAKELSHFDVKLLKDLLPLVFRPGFLTKEYLEGRVNSHIKPVTMFVWVNVIFFLWGYKAVFPQAMFRAADFYWPGLKAKALASATAMGIEEMEYITRFNEHLVHYEKYLIFFVIPVFAFVLFLLFSYRRENYFVKHLVYSVHFWCYLFIYFAVAPALFGLLNGAYGRLTGALLFTRYDGPLFLIVSLTGIVPYTWFALRKVFGENAWVTTSKTLAIVFVVGYLRSWGIGLTYYAAYLATR